MQRNKFQLDGETLRSTWEDWYKFNVLESSNGSLFNHLKILANNQRPNILESGLKTLLAEIAELTLYGSLGSTFAWRPSSARVDYLVTGVIIINKEEDALKVAISEPWALTACIEFFSSTSRIPLLMDRLSELLESTLNLLGSEDTAKGLLHF